VIRRNSSLNSGHSGTRRVPISGDNLALSIAGEKHAAEKEKY